MFVPVGCGKCGKPFQVPEAAAGKTVACPWCKASVLALPVAGLPDPPPEPLSLDAPDEPAPLPPPPPRPRPRRLPKAAGMLAVLAVVAAGSFVAIRAVSGLIPDSVWEEFLPPDGGVSVSLPGRPAPEELPPNPAAPNAGGAWHVARGWANGVEAWVGWRDLDAGWVGKGMADKGWAALRPLIEGERDWQKARWNGTVTREATIRFDEPQTVELVMETPRGRVAERFYVSLAGPKPRLYFVGLLARNRPADDPAARRLFDSFQVRK